MKRLNSEIGSVYAINTSQGYAVFQCVAKSEKRIDIVRVMSPFLARLEDFEPTILLMSEVYFVKIMVKLAHEKGLIEYIGKFNVPDDVRVPNKFRSLDYNPYKGWRRWYEVDENMNSRKLITAVDDRFLSLSSYGIWNVALLRERLENGWRLQDWK